MMNKSKKPGVMLYFDQCAVLRQMPMEDAYALVMAILDFAQHGVAPEFKNPALTYAWGFIQLSIERDSARYDRTVEQRRKAARQRWSQSKARDGLSPEMEEVDADASI